MQLEGHRRVFSDVVYVDMTETLAAISCTKMKLTREYRLSTVSVNRLWPTPNGSYCLLFFDTNPIPIVVL
jgi:hypothetical protein